MTHKVTKPKPAPVPPALISIEMTLREAILIRAFIGGFSGHDFVTNANSGLIRNGFNEPFTNREEGINESFFDALNNAIVEAKSQP